MPNGAAAPLTPDEVSPPASGPRVPPPASAEPAPGSGAHPAWNQALVALCVASIAFHLVQILSYGHGRDQGIYTVVARSMLEGGMPYREAWDFKPPGIFVVFAVARALFGRAEVGVRVLEVLCLLVQSWAMIRLARRHWGEWRIGLVAAAIAVMIHAQLDFWHTAQPESFGGVLTVLALLLASPPSQSSPRWGTLRLVGVGVLFGLAGLLKPPLAGGGVVLALAMGIREHRRGLDVFETIRPAALIGLGGALPLAVCLLWFHARGALGDLHATLVVFTPHYTALGWERMTVAGMGYYAFTEWLCSYSSVAMAGLAALLALRPRPHERAGVAVLCGIVAMHLVGVAMQGKFFPYHYGATWPLTAGLAALGGWRAWEAARRRAPRGVAIFFLALLPIVHIRSATKDLADSYGDRCVARLAILLGRPASPQQHLELASVADVNAVANHAVADFIRARVAPERAFYVWGFEPVIYDLAERRSASRYIYNVPQRVSWGQSEARATLMRDLDADPPQVIVVERRDVFPSVTGEPFDSADTLPDFPELEARIAGGYDLATTIEDFDLYVERAASIPAGQ